MDILKLFRRPQHTCFYCCGGEGLIQVAHCGSVYEPCDIYYHEECLKEVLMHHREHAQCANSAAHIVDYLEQEERKQQRAIEHVEKAVQAYHRMRGEQHRPNKFMDCSRLEKWMNLHYFEIYDEWESEGYEEHQNLWDFVCEKYPDEMDEFESWFKRNCL